MKVLFIGEGPHDVGGPNGHVQAPFPAGGVVTELAKRVLPSISKASVALKWRDIVRFAPKAERREIKHKVEGAKLIAKEHDCDAVVLVRDSDNLAPNVRLSELQACKSGALPIACGVAVRSVEAWTLGAPSALAEELGVSVAEVRKHYPAGPGVEQLYENSGKKEHRPKALLAKIFSDRHRDDDRHLREAVAGRTDPEQLCDACPQGFKPFRDELLELIEWKS